MKYNIALICARKKGNDTNMNIKRLTAGICVVCTLLFATACAQNTPDTSPSPTPTPEPDHDILSDCYDFNLDEHIKLGQYKNIVIEVRDPAPTQEELDEFFTNFLEKYAVLNEVTDRTVSNGDVVNIDYKGYVDGEAKSGMADTDTDLEIGSASFIPGFEEALIGAAIGETVSFDITFPEDYWNSSMASVEARFDVTINAIYEKELPELTDAFVAEKTDYSTVEEYRRFIIDELTKDNQEHIDSSYKASVWGEAIANAEVIEYPQDMYDEYYNILESSIKQQAEYYGITLEEFVKYNGYDMDGFYELLDTRSKESVKELLVLFAISNEENIRIPWTEYQELAKGYFEKLSVDSFEELEQKYSRKDICCDIAFDKVIELLLETASQKIV